jgi:hypothetical protein
MYGKILQLVLQSLTNSKRGRSLQVDMISDDLISRIGHLWQRGRFPDVGPDFQYALLMFFKSDPFPDFQSSHIMGPHTRLSQWFLTLAKSLPLSTTAPNDANLDFWWKEGAVIGTVISMQGHH